MEMVTFLPRGRWNSNLTIFLVTLTCSSLCWILLMSLNIFRVCGSVRDGEAVRRTLSLYCDINNQLWSSRSGSCVDDSNAVCNCAYMRGNCTYVRARMQERRMQVTWLHSFDVVVNEVNTARATCRIVCKWLMRVFAEDLWRKKKQTSQSSGEESLWARPRLGKLTGDSIHNN